MRILTAGNLEEVLKEQKEGRIIAAIIALVLLAAITAGSEFIWPGEGLWSQMKAEVIEWLRPTICS